jgi:lysophospholipase L1-like esterase
VEEHPHVGLVDWHSIAADHPELFVEDRVHPNAEGRMVLADAIRTAVDVP